MATEQEVRRKITPRVATKVRSELTFDECVAALNAMNTGNKTAFVNAVRNSSAQAIGRLMIKAARDAVDLTAEAEVDVILADGAVDLAEFDRIS